MECKRVLCDRREVQVRGFVGECWELVVALVVLYQYGTLRSVHEHVVVVGRFSFLDANKFVRYAEALQGLEAFGAVIVVADHGYESRGESETFCRDRGISRVSYRTDLDNLFICNFVAKRDAYLVLAMVHDLVEILELDKRVGSNVADGHKVVFHES